MRSSCALALGLGLLWRASPALASPERPVVAVFEIQSSGTQLKARTLDSLSEFIGAQLTASGQYVVVPGAELKAAMKRQRSESYKECYDERCQIEVGKEVAAEKSLTTKISRFGSKCVLTLSLYDLRKAAAERAATHMGGCGEEAVLGSAVEAVAKLTGRASQPAQKDVAQTAPARRPAPSASVVASADGAEAQAKAHYAQGQRFYQEGRYQEALSSFQQAYQRAPKPVLLYNIAQCHNRMGAMETAIEMMRRYLVEERDRRAQRQGRRELKRLLKEQRRQKRLTGQR